MNKLKRDKSTSGLIILGEVSFEMRNLSMDGRATLLLNLPGFIVFFLLLMFMIKLSLHFYSPCIIDYFMPNAVWGERHIELF